VFLRIDDARGVSMPRPRTTLVALTALTAGALGAGGPASATPADPSPEKQSLAVGTGGAVATVDADATRVGLEVLAAGGNAADVVLGSPEAPGPDDPDLASRLGDD
jgi:gamma-glutamyltranspeptidase/glutathione hydrolase